MDNNNKYISGFTMKPESEIDDEYTDEMILDGEHNYDANNLLDAFGTSDFENAFKLNYQDILSFPASDIIILCRMFNSKIQSLYDYQIIPQLSLNNMKDVTQFFNFLKFLDFDNTSFLSQLCSELNMTVVDISHTKDFTKIKDSKLINIIDILSDNYKYNSLIFDFLRVYSRDKMIKWVNKQFIRNKSEIVSNML